MAKDNRLNTQNGQLTPREALMNEAPLMQRLNALSEACGYQDVSK